MTALSGGRPELPGVLLILNDVLTGMELEFNRWYQQQHIPERLAIDGFNAARRYQALGAQPAYMAVYECSSIEGKRPTAPPIARYEIALPEPIVLEWQQLIDTAVGPRG